ncbi:hypothetical protein RvVAR031_24620 [Agrobacterium vitis]|nr:hypothetical protein RvVAR031_24620 [Agrobacterium vitis]
MQIPVISAAARAKSRVMAFTCSGDSSVLSAIPQIVSKNTVAEILEDMPVIAVLTHPIRHITIICAPYAVARLTADNFADQRFADPQGGHP